MSGNYLGNCTSCPDPCAVSTCCTKTYEVTAQIAEAGSNYAGAVSAATTAFSTDPDWDEEYCTNGCNVSVIASYDDIEISDVIYHDVPYESCCTPAFSFYSYYETTGYGATPAGGPPFTRTRSRIYGPCAEFCLQICTTTSADDGADCDEGTIAFQSFGPILAGAHLDMAPTALNQYIISLTSGPCAP